MPLTRAARCFWQICDSATPDAKEVAQNYLAIWEAQATGIHQAIALCSSSRTAARATAFSSGNPIEIRAHRSYGGNARPMSTPLSSNVAAKSAWGTPVSKNTKLALDAVNFTFN